MLLDPHTFLRGEMRAQKVKMRNVQLSQCILDPHT